jgi:hypothetical protein
MAKSLNHAADGSSRFTPAILKPDVLEAVSPSGKIDI